MKITTKELALELMIPIVFILLFYGIFTLLQNETIYHATIGKITQTYLRLDDQWDITNVDMPYKKIDEQNLVNWDAVGYNYLKDNAPGDTDIELSYGFFPMFSWIWKLTGISVKYIGVFNFLIFSFSLLLLLHLFLRSTGFRPYEKTILFVTCLSFPSVIIYLLPYSEAVFTTTFFLAIWGLIRRKYWIYFLFMMLAAMSRASVILVIASIIVTDLFFFLRDRSLKRLFKEVSLKLLPFIIGMLAVFTYHYIYSGNFFKYYEVQSTLWTNNLQWPTKLADWSLEGFGMNIAAIFLVTLPGLIYFFSWYKLKPKNNDTKYPSVFHGKITEIKEYFFLNSIIFFTGFFLYILLFRGGSIHCFHRFTISSPYFFIFILILLERLPSLKMKQTLFIFTPGFIMGMLFILLIYNAGLNFQDSGYLLFSFLIFYLLFFHYMKSIPRTLLIIFLALCAIIWFTFLYNNYISCAWIFA